MFFSLKFKSRFLLSTSIFFFFWQTVLDSLIHTFSFAVFSTLVKCTGNRVMFSIWGQFVKTCCKGASIPTTAAADAALLYSCACLQDFQGSVGPSVGTSGSNLSHRYYKLPSTLPHTLPVHTCMQQTQKHTRPQKGYRCYYLWTSPTLIKMWQLAYCSPPTFFFCSVSYWFPWPDLILGSHIWALIRERDAASITSTQG